MVPDGEEQGIPEAAPRQHEPTTAEDVQKRERIVRETREAGMRAEGGGIADEADIQASAEENEQEG